MPIDDRLIYWDACCFLSWINADVDRVDLLESLLTDSADPKSPMQIITSVLSIAEVAFAEMEAAAKTAHPQALADIESLWSDRFAVKLVEMYEGIALEARGLMREAMLRGWRLQAADAVHLATAKRLNVAEFHTFDEGLDKFSELVGFPVIRPITLQAARVTRPGEVADQRAGETPKDGPEQNPKPSSS
jgi:predicted nucleic acid-binding protein